MLASPSVGNASSSSARLRAYIAWWACSSSLQSIATSAACWLGDGGVRNRLPAKARAASMCMVGTSSQPSRQSTMLQYLEKLLTTKASSANSRIECAASP